MRKYLKCNFIRDYNDKKPNYNIDSISDMRKALEYYEEVIDDIDSQVDEILSYFKDFISTLKLNNEMKENIKDLIQNIQDLEFSPRGRNGLLTKLFFEAYKESNPGYCEKMKKIQEEKDKKVQENYNEYVEYFINN